MASNVLVGGAVWTAKTRICPLDPNGNLIPGSNLYVTDTLVKATMTPVNEAGDAISVKKADGNLGVFAVKGDIPKWYTVAIELVTPDNALEQLLTGGVLLNDVSAALGLVTGLAVTGQTTLGTLAAGTYVYAVSQYNAYGETVPCTSVSVTNTGSTSTNVLSGMVAAAGALGFIAYGRNPGGVYKIGTLAYIGTQATSAASGTASPTTLAVTALTKPIPAGYTFQIAGDTNTVKIVFTTLASADVGSVALSVSESQTITTTIAAGNIVPVFVDNGSIVPVGVPSATDMTAGPGNAVGFEAPSLGSVGNPNGCSIELFMENIKNGAQATDYPYWRIVIPRAFGFVVGARDATNANMASVYTGLAVQNPNFGSGPMGDWQFDSSRVVERAVCGSQIVPAASAQPVAASF
jgi:hypothetical protein